MVSNLFVIGYKDVATASAVRDKILQLRKEQLIEIDDIVVVENRGGKIKLHQAQSMTGVGAAGGALWGGLIGLLFFMPLVGMAIGAGAGALGGAMTDIGVDDKMMKKMAAQLKPGTAAVFVLVRSSTKDKVIAELGPYGGEIIQTSLPKEAEKHLEEALSAARANADATRANGKTARATAAA